MKPLVSIIITTYLPESKPYLDECVKSCLNVAYENKEIILVGRPTYQPQYEGVKTVVFPSDDFGNSQGMNFGVVQSKGDYLLIVNDDVILTKSIVDDFLYVVGNDSIIAGPISPCDNYDKYTLGFAVEDHVFYERQYRLEDVKDVLPKMKDAKSVYGPGALMVDHFYFFCVFMPKYVYESVGPFEERFKTGPDDVDYCIRAQKLGIPRVILLNALAWHFSGVTADKTITDELRVKNAKAFKEIHGFFPPFFNPAHFGVDA